jgi:hypothetical protein
MDIPRLIRVDSSFNHIKYEGVVNEPVWLICLEDQYDSIIVITNISSETKKYKEFNDKCKLYISPIRKYNLFYIPTDVFYKIITKDESKICRIYKPPIVDNNEILIKQINTSYKIDTEFYNDLIYNGKLNMEYSNIIHANGIYDIHTDYEINNIQNYNIPTNIWNISDTDYRYELIKSIRENIQYSSNTHLLDFTKKKYSILEKYVHDIAIFHVKRMGIMSLENHYIEFWVKDKSTYGLHVDCDESIKNITYKYPLLSCITYLNDNQSKPTIITNIDMECYKYKRFEKQTEIFFSFPVKNKQITFDGRNFHGCTSICDDSNDERFIIALNIWNVKPNNIEYFNADLCTGTERSEISNDTILVSTTACELEINKQGVSDDIINYDFFNDILYNIKDIKTCYRFKEFTTANIQTSFILTLDKNINERKKEDQLKKVYGNRIIEDYNRILNSKNDITYNRFIQRFIYKGIYTQDICRFIINECELHAKNNDGWTTKRHSVYPTTDLPVEAVTSICGIIFQTLETILDKIKLSYELTNSGINFDIKDLFVVKYSDNGQNSLDMHHDGSFISFGILLSDVNNFEGGGTYFEDGLTTRLDQGDILIHSGLIKHSGLKVTKGTRYILVGFVNITFTL